MPSCISAIRLRGFKSVGDRELHVDVPRGLVAVTGRCGGSWDRCHAVYMPYDCMLKEQASSAHMLHRPFVHLHTVTV